MNLKELFVETGSIRSFSIPPATASFAITSSYVVSASYAANGGGATNFSTGSYTGSFTGSLFGTASFATTASAATSLTYTVATASYALSAGATGGGITGAGTSGQLALWSSGVLTSSILTDTGTRLTTGFPITASAFKGDGSNITSVITASYAPLILPQGVVSASAQYSTGSYTGSFTGSLFGNATSASYALTASYAMNGGGATNFSTGSYTGSFIGVYTGSHTGSFIGDGIGLINIVSSSYALSASYAPGGAASISASYASTSSLASGLLPGNQTISGTLIVSTSISASAGTIFGKVLSTSGVGLIPSAGSLKLPWGATQVTMGQGPGAGQAYVVLADFDGNATIFLGCDTAGAHNATNIEIKSNLLFTADNSGDIGTTSGNRPNNVYAATRYDMKSGGTYKFNGTTFYDGTSLVSSRVVTNGLVTNIVTKAVNYTLTNVDHTVLGDATSGVITLTLPSASVVPNQMYTLMKTDASANAVIVAGTVNSASNQSLTTQFNTITIHSNGANWYKIAGL